MNTFAIVVLVLIVPNFILLLWHLAMNIGILFLHRQYPDVIFTYATRKTYNDARGCVPVKKMIAISIDDAPYGGTHNIHRILDVFKWFQCRATFFVIGSYLEEHDRNDLLLRRMVDDGHEIGNHGYTNSRAVRLSDADLIGEIDKTHKLFDKQNDTKLYRPGCGYFSQSMINVCKSLNHTLVLGSVYSFDPQIPFPWIHYFHISSTAVSGDIVILHDRWWTIPLLWVLLPTLKWRGFEVTTVSRLLQEKKSRTNIFDQEFAFPIQAIVAAALMVFSTFVLRFFFAFISSL